MIVLFELMAHCEDQDRRRVFDLEQRDVSAVSEGNDQLAKEGAAVGLATREGRCSQRGKAGPDGLQRLLGQRGVATFSSQFALDHKIEQALEVSLRLARQANPETH